MSHPDDVFAAFVGANPVPETAFDDVVRPSAKRFLSNLARGDTIMTDINAVRDTENESHVETQGGSTRRAGESRRPWIAAAAAALLVALLGGMWFAWINRADDTEPATPQPAEDIESEALEAAELWLASLNTGDVETILGIASSDQTDVANQRMYEYHAVFAANGTPSTELQGCEAVQTTDTLVAVDCAIVLGDPVAEAVGIPEMIFPFLYADGVLSWQSARGGDIGLLNRAYADYLSRFHPVEYDAACSPNTYEPGSVIQSRGIALTAECAALQVLLSIEVAEWIRNGRPES